MQFKASDSLLPRPTELLSPGAAKITKTLRHRRRRALREQAPRRLLGLGRAALQAQRVDPRGLARVEQRD